MLLTQQFRARSGCQELGIHHFHIHAGSSWTAKTSLASLADAEASRRLTGKIRDAGDHDGA